MAESPLHVRSKLAKCTVVLDELEKGIIAETVLASRLETNPTVAHAVAFGANRP